MALITEQDLQRLKHHFPDLKFKANFKLSRITYFKLGGPAELLVKVEELNLLINLLQYCQQHDLRFTILGGASNVIVSDQGVAGLVILTRHQQVEVLEETQKKTMLQAESGIRTSTLVSEAVEQGLVGLEPFLGVPGRLGGAVFNNAHFKNDYIGDYIHQVEVLDQSGDVIWLSQDECNFDYDNSRFQTSGEVILRVQFNLKHGDKTTSKEKIKEATLYRIRTQPLGMPSSGCIFQNIPNNDDLKKQFPQFKDAEHVSAGFLIDKAGLKGLKQGGAKVSKKHAAFIVNEGNATAQDVLALIEQIKSQVKQEFNVELQEEVFWLE